MQTVIGRPEEAIATLEESQSTLLRWMAQVNVDSEDEQRNAEDLLIHARQALKDAETKRKELLEPVFETRDRINNLFKPYTDKLNMGIFITNKALQDYHTQQMKQVETARLEALAEQAATLAEARETGEVVELPTTEALPAAPVKTSRAHLGTVTYREDIEVSIVNPFLVPRELCDPNLSRIRARAKSGVTEIPGVLISTKYTTVAVGR